ncbi:MAG TPA: GNAT family N-acetyltransferase [Rhizomicrobium sp.]|nr:GNAT family N-acetyltransferase [Rhizomicrobium sp.]
MITIRDYQECDCETLAQIFIRAVRQIARRDYSPAQIAAWAPDIDDMAAFAARRGDKPTFVAEYDGQVAGFTDLDSEGHIDMFYVSPDFQRRGVGSAMLRFITARAQSERVKRLYGEVSITARPVFERHGFKVLAYQTVQTNGQALGNYRMEKLL